nr:DNA polymerase III subunit delta [Pseudoclavibacter sp. Marseille-Q3772]
MPAAKKNAKAAAKTKLQQVSWLEVRPAPVALLSGAEEFFAAEAIRNLRSILRTEDPALEVHEIDAKHHEPGEFSTVVSPSLFMEPRLVIVQNVHETTDSLLTEVIDYLQAPIEGTTIILRHKSGARGKKLLDAVRALPDAIEVPCAPLKANELDDFVRTLVRYERRSIQPLAARALVAAFNTDLEELAAAVRQLMNVSTESEITPELVDRYYGGRVETTGFKIADAAIAGRLPDALRLLRAGFDTGLNPVPIVSAIAMKLRMMAKVSGLSGSDAQLAGTVGAAPWQVGQARRELRGWTDEELARAIQLTAETDHMVKGKSREPEFAAERLVRKIALRER